MPCCLCFCIIILVFFLCVSVVRGSIGVLGTVVEVLALVTWVCLPLLLSLLDTLLLDVLKCSVDSLLLFLAVEFYLSEFFLVAVFEDINLCLLGFVCQVLHLAPILKFRFCFNLKGFLVGFVLLLGCFLCCFCCFFTCFLCLFGCTFGTLCTFSR